MRVFMAVLVLSFVAGCNITTETTTLKPIPESSEPVDVRIAIGQIVDSRLKEKGQKLGQKQIHIGAAKVKNSLADTLTKSKRFRQIVNLPTQISGIAMSQMLEAARTANCDYLLMGEIDQFDMIDLGANGRSVTSALLEGLTAPVGFIVFILSYRKNGVWVNAIIYDRTGMGVISLSLHFVETVNGKVVGHLSNRVSKATRPMNVLVYGDLANPDDDWIDIGKELGLVALHNLTVDLIDQIAIEVDRIQKTR